MELFKTTPSIKVKRPTNNWYQMISGRLYKEDYSYAITKSIQEISDFCKILINDSVEAIKDECKVYVSDKSTFPATLLNKLGTSIKRSVTIEDADYIVLDTVDIKVVSNRYIGVLYKTDDTIYRYYCGDSESIKAVYDDWQNCEAVKNKDDVYYYINVPNIEKYEKYFPYLNKLISTKTLLKNIYSKINKPTEDEAESMFSLIRSNNENNVKLALKTMSFYNIDGLEPFFIKYLRGYLTQDNVQLGNYNTLERFAFYRLGYSPMELFNHFYNLTNCLYYYIVTNKIDITLEQKRKLIDINEIFETQCDFISKELDLIVGKLEFAKNEDFVVEAPDSDPRIQIIKDNFVTHIRYYLEKWLDYLEYTPKIII